MLEPRGSRGLASLSHQYVVACTSGASRGRCGTPTPPVRSIAVIHATQAHPAASPCPRSTPLDPPGPQL